MGFYAEYPVTGSGSGGGVTIYPDFAGFPAASTVVAGTLGVAADTGILYESNGSVWTPIGGPGVPLSVGTFDSGTPSTNGAHIDSTALIMQSASASNPGLVNTGAQTIAGVKTFSSAPVMSALSASQAVVTDGGKSLGSLAYSATGGTSNLVSRDANGNAKAVNWISGATNVVSASGTTVLTAASTRLQQLAGSANQTFQLPDATTLSVGATFEFNNNSSGILTVVDNGSNSITTVPSGGYGRIVAIAVSTANGSWDRHFLVPSNSSWGSGALTVGGSVSASNLSGTNTGDVTIATANGLSLAGQALSLGTSSGSTTGALTSSDWSTFNGKQAAGNYITALTSDVAASGPGSAAATIANNAVTNAKAAQMATLTIKGNNTGGTANASDLTVTQTKAMLNTAMTVQRFTSSSGIYTTPTSPAPLYIKIKMCGAGGGGSGSGSTGGTPNASPGGSSTWSVHSGAAILTSAGGASGGTNQGGLPGSGGAPTTAAGATVLVSISGGSGGGGGNSAGTTYAEAGGIGGANPFGGAGKSGTGGSAGGGGATNTGAGGGGGAGSSTANVSAGHGGGAGAYIEAFIASPSASYDYAVGAGASGGTNGTGGQSGGQGGSGVIIVEEYYQ